MTFLPNYVMMGQALGDVLCPACHKIVDPKDQFCGWCGESMEVPTVRESTRLEELRDAETVAKKIYKYWLKSLRTDKVIEADEADEWDDMDEQMRQNFIEAVDVEAVRRFDRILSDLEVELAIAESSAAIDAMQKPESKEQPPVAKWKAPTSPACYYCGRGEAVRDRACRICLKEAREE